MDGSQLYFEFRIGARCHVACAAERAELFTLRDIGIGATPAASAHALLPLELAKVLVMSAKMSGDVKRSRKRSVQKLHGNAPVWRR